MRFLLRSLGGLFITAATFGLLFLAAFQIWQALEQSRSGGPGGREAQEQAFTVRLLTLEAGSVDPVMQVFGAVESRRRLELRAGASGRITFLDPDLHEGGSVEAGQRLVQTDPSAAQAALDTLLAAEAEGQAALADANRAVTIATDDLAAARAQAELRRAAVQRQQNLAERGLGTSANREAAELAASSADQAVLSRRSALAEAESAVSTAQLALRRNGIDLAEARRTLDLTQVNASFAGRVTSVTAVEGGLVSQNEQLAEIIDPDALRGADTAVAAAVFAAGRPRRGAGRHAGAGGSGRLGGADHGGGASGSRGSLGRRGRRGAHRLCPAGPARCPPAPRRLRDRRD